MWNETLMVSIANLQTDVLLFEVYDKDTFSTDDSIGNAALALGDFAISSTPLTLTVPLKNVKKGWLEIEVSFTSL